jgi:imidazolonepropionase
LATCPADNIQSDAGLIDNAAVILEEGKIAWAGSQKLMPVPPRRQAEIDCRGALVVPGLVDCHTHLCFGGWRGDEFELRLRGASYQEVAAAGGGIRSTVEATRSSDASGLLARARQALDSMLELGVTTVECKSGYGLDLKNELKQLQVYADLNRAHEIDLVSTFLGAHVVPEEFGDNSDTYVDMLCEQMLPRVAEKSLAEFCDVFVEKGAFSLNQGRRILQRAASLGLGLKIHADQLSDGGGALLAAELGATSAEHLEYISDAGIKALAQSGTVAVSLPLASLYLRERYLPARKLLDSGVPVAIATDFNPGSAPSFHLPLAMTLACLNQQMTPEEALMGATSVAARAIGRKASAGSVLPGYPADIAIIDAPDVNHWLYHFRANACLAVVKGGHWVQRMKPAY